MIPLDRLIQNWPGTDKLAEQVSATASVEHSSNNERNLEKANTLKAVTQTEDLSTRDMGLDPVSDPRQSTSSSEVNGPSKVSDDPILDEILLEAIGKRSDTEKARALSIHSDIVKVWEHILKNGLPKEEREQVSKKYLVPENCTKIEPPRLNPEVKGSLTEPIITRDNRMIEKQNKVTVCLAALSAILNDLIKGKSQDTVEMITTLSDVCRVLVDLQRDESLTRRLIILTNLNASLKGTLNATDTDEWLFGNSFDETLKAAKTLERTAK